MNAISTMLKSTAAAAMAFCCLQASAAVNVVADPESGATLSELSEVTLTFPDASEVDYGSQKNNVLISTTDFSRTCTLEYGDEANQIVVSFLKINENGDYTLEIPEDAITADGQPVEAFTLSYTIGKEVTKNATLLPAPGEVTWLYEFTFSDPDVDASLNVDRNAGTPTLTSPSGDVSPIFDVYNWEIGNGKYQFRLRKLANEPGTYKITFPDNYLYYNDASWTKQYLPGYEFEYEVKGGVLTEVVSDPSMTKPTLNFNHLSMEFPGYDTVAIAQLSYSEASIPFYIEGKDEALSSFYLMEGYNNFSVEGNKLSYTNQYSDYITPGHYFLTIPGGSILLGEDKTPCTPFVIDFEVVAPEAAVIDVTPADGSTVSMLNKATITFPEIAQVDLTRSPSVRLQKVTVEEGEEKLVSIGGAYSASSFSRLADNSFLATFDAMALTDGDYRITIVTNSFIYDGGFNQEYNVDVKFVAPAAPKYEMSPDPAVAQDKLQHFTITFPTESVVKVNTPISKKTSTLYEGDELVSNGYGGYINATVSAAYDYTLVEGTTNSFSFSLNSAGINKGKYTLVIPAGIFLMGEDESSFNDQILVVYECTGEGIDKIEVTPSEPVRELKEMKITYINETSISLQTSYTGFSLYQYVEGQSYGTYITYLSGDNLKVEGNSITITLTDPITEAGTYYIEIGSYSFYMSDGTTASTPQKVFFTVDPLAPVSVESVQAVPTDNRIFTLTGIEVKEMKTPGIYVVNGKKVVVKQ